MQQGNQIIDAYSNQEKYVEANSQSSKALDKLHYELKRRNCCTHNIMIQQGDLR